MRAIREHMASVAYARVDTDNPREGRLQMNFTTLKKRHFKSPPTEEKQNEKLTFRRNLETRIYFKRTSTQSNEHRFNVYYSSSSRMLKEKKAADELYQFPETDTKDSNSRDLLRQNTGYHNKNQEKWTALSQNKEHIKKLQMNFTNSKTDTKYSVSDKRQVEWLRTGQDLPLVEPTTAEEERLLSHDHDLLVTPTDNP
ncbi:hypothetical protein EVAR_68220_1 [Eumeta japonica]|uniref:Uncharacterized protein n=1 Tax=Eumeta variegata TaxID=151549 RepID=A0A4C1ZZ28_EUMVA|nr:hypothetical protein EVAR_68220_1 [Eumeta japonica]